MRWDLDYVYKSDDWDLLAPTDDELPAWEQEALANPLAKEHGTVVLWSGLEEAAALAPTTFGLARGFSRG